MSKAEEAAYKAYPYNGDYRGQGDSNSKIREAYINGYHQAEKRLKELFDLTDYAAKDIADELMSMARKQIAYEINIYEMVSVFCNNAEERIRFDSYFYQKGIEDTLKAIGGK